MYGSPPTDLNARIEELTPPGIASAERVYNVWLLAIPLPTQTVAVQPAATQDVESHNGIIDISAIVLGKPASKIRENNVCSCALHCGQLFECNCVVIDPAVCGSGLDPSIW